MMEFENADQIGDTINYLRMFSSISLEIVSWHLNSFLMLRDMSSLLQPKVDFYFPINLSD